jgi:putative CocE/NonD family hydrolase
MYGFSYVGATQWMPATLKPPSLVAIVPAMTSSDYYDGWSYEGGAWSLAFEESWPLVTIALTGARRLGDQASIDRMNGAVRDLWATYKFLPIKDYPWLSPGRPEVAPYFYDWIKHDTWDDYWKQWSIRTRYDQVQVPALNFSGWYDVFMNGAMDDPFTLGAREVEKLRKEAAVIIVDMHAEASSEKTALGYHLDGTVSAVVGTHTHVPTCDHRILPKGTAYCTDLGMTGPYDSVIGVEAETIVKRFITAMPARFETAKNDPRFAAVVVTVDPKTGRATAIDRMLLGEGDVGKL